MPRSCPVRKLTDNQALSSHRCCKDLRIAITNNRHGSTADDIQRNAVERLPFEALMKDFFVSYNQHDREKAEWIAWQLEDAGYEVAFPPWDCRPGNSFPNFMDKAAQEAHATIAVLSETYLTSPYTRPEWEAAFIQDPTGKDRMLLPVLVRECKLPPMLARIVYVNLVGIDEEEARTQLLAAVDEKRPKPLVSPAFHAATRPRPAFSASTLQPNYRDEHARKVGEQLRKLIETEDALRASDASPEKIQAIVSQARGTKAGNAGRPAAPGGLLAVESISVLLEELGSGGFRDCVEGVRQQEEAQGSRQGAAPSAQRQFRAAGPVPARGTDHVPAAA